MCDDVIREVFLHFDVVDLKNSSLVCKQWKKIVLELSIIKCSFTTRSKVYDDIISFFKNCIYLKHLDLSHCFNLTDRGILNIGYLQNLTFLDLTSCKMLTEITIKHFSKYKNLVELNLSLCIGIKSKGFLYLSGLKNLKSLNLFGCYVEDVSLEFLKYISLENFVVQCDKLTRDGLQFLKRHENLKKLNLLECNHLDNAFVNCLNTNINELSIDGGHRFRGNGHIYYAFKNIHEYKLITLIVIGSVCMTDDSLRSVSQIPTLKNIKMSNCHCITFRGMQFFLQNCKTITNIVIFNRFNMPQITDTEVEILCNRVKSGEKISADLWNCFDISPEAKERLIKIVNINQGWRSFAKEEEPINDIILKKRKALEKALTTITGYLKQREITVDSNYKNIIENHKLVQTWFDKNTGTIEDYDIYIDKLTEYFE